MPMIYNHPVGFHIHAAGRFHIMEEYTTEKMKSAENLTFLRAITLTSANVTDANAVSNRKYIPVMRPVPK